MNEELYPWALELKTLYDQAWHRLIRGVHDRRAAARHPTLATVSQLGLPNLRTVVLRTIDKEQSVLEIHTNIHSAKIVDLKANSAAGLHIWDEACRLQIRVSAQASVIYGQAVECTWGRVPLDSRKAYSGSAIPGTPISSSNAYDSVPDVNAFAVIKLHILEMDLLHLGAQHRRARFARDDAWAGQWLIP